MITVETEGGRFEMTGSTADLGFILACLRYSAPFGGKAKNAAYGYASIAAIESALNIKGE